MSDKDERTVYVSNLHHRCTKDILEELFIQLSPVESVFLQEGGNSRYALIVLDDEDSVPFCCEMFDGINLFEWPIKVTPKAGSRQLALYNAKKTTEEAKQIVNQQLLMSHTGNQQSPMANTSSHNFHSPSPLQNFQVSPYSRRRGGQSVSSHLDHMSTPPYRFQGETRTYRDDYNAPRRDDERHPAMSNRYDRGLNSPHISRGARNSRGFGGNSRGHSPRRYPQW